MPPRGLRRGRAAWSGPLGQEVQVLPASRHGVDDNLVPALEDEDHRLQEAGTGVETQAQLPSWRAALVERLDPQRPHRRLDRILRGDAVLECARVDVHAAKWASAARIASDLLMWLLAAAASRASSSSTVSRTATTCIGSAPRPGRPRPRRFNSSTSYPASASAAHVWICSSLTMPISYNEKRKWLRTWSHLDPAAVAGGLPQAVLSPDPAFRRRWYASYLEQVVTRDAEGVGAGRDPVRLRRYLDVLAETTAGLPTDTTLVEAGGINVRTAAAYDRLLQALGVLDVVPAWSTNRLKRLTQRGKRYLTDGGLVAAALRTDAPSLLRDGALMGPILDTYVTAQVRAEASASDAMPRLYHLRDRDGHEIDLLLDYGRRGQLAIEVRATSAPTRHDARHLIWLRERLPTLRAGLVLHTGPRVYRLDDTIAAVPIAALWA